MQTTTPIGDSSNLTIFFWKNMAGLKKCGAVIPVRDYNVKACIKEHKAVVRVLSFNRIKELLKQLSSPCYPRSIKQYPFDCESDEIQLYRKNPLTGKTKIITKYLNLRGQTKSVPYIKKLSCTLMPPDMRMILFNRPSTVEIRDLTSFGLLFNIDFCNIKGGKYFFCRDVASDKKPWLAKKEAFEKKGDKAFADGWCQSMDLEGLRKCNLSPGKKQLGFGYNEDYVRRLDDCPPQLINLTRRHRPLKVGINTDVPIYNEILVAPSAKALSAILIINDGRILPDELDDHINEAKILKYEIRQKLCLDVPILLLDPSTSPAYMFLEEHYKKIQALPEFKS